MKRVLLAVVLLAGCLDLEGAYQRRLAELDGGSAGSGGGSSGGSGGGVGGGSGGGTAGGSSGGGAVAPVDCLVPDAGACTAPVCLSRVFTLGGMLNGVLFVDGGVLAVGRADPTEMGGSSPGVLAVLDKDCNFIRKDLVAQLAVPRAATGTSENDLSIATAGRVAQVTSAGGTSSTDCNGLPNVFYWYDVTRTSDGVAWYSGDHASVCRYDGGFHGDDLAALIPFGFNNLYSIWAAPDDTVWIGGAYGYLLKWSPGAAAPEFIKLANTQDITGGAATASRVWAGGSYGLLVAGEDDGGWRESTLGSGAWNGLWASGDEAWAVSSSGTLAVWKNGIGWSQTSVAGIPANAIFLAVVGGPGNVLYVVGNDDGGGHLWQLVRR